MSEKCPYESTLECSLFYRRDEAYYQSFIENKKAGLHSTVQSSSLQCMADPQKCGKLLSFRQCEKQR